VAAATVKMIQKLKLELLPHPTYSSYLASSGYHTSGPLKNLCRCQFENDEEVKDNVCMTSQKTKNILCRWHQDAHGLK
jgi:hypothetical protein